MFESLLIYKLYVSTGIISTVFILTAIGQMNLLWLLKDGTELCRQKRHEQEESHSTARRHASQHEQNLKIPQSTQRD